MEKRAHIVFIFLIGSFFLLCPNLQGGYPGGQGGEHTIPREGNTSADPGERGLSMDIKDEPLKNVLEKISQQEGITFHLAPSLGEERVMLRFSNLTVKEGLNKILDPYNRIFIYHERPTSSGPPAVRLKEVKIFPYEYVGRVKEPAMTISDGASETKGAVRSEEKREDRVASSDAGSRGETYVKTLTRTLRGSDPEAKIDAIKVLKDAGTMDAVRALSFGIRDNNPTVKNEAVRALQGIGKELIDERAVDPLPDGDNEEEDETEQSSKTDEGPPPTLQVLSSSGNSTSIALTNEVPVRGVQFTLNGANPTDVKTTARTEGFLATFNKNKVLLVSLSGNTIAPGSGPVVEVVGSGGSTASLSGVVIGE